MARFKVQVWIYRWDQSTRKYRFLLLKTREGRGAFWQPVTGGVEEGEPLEAAAAREANEETGLHFLSNPQAIGSSFQFESQWGGTVTEHGFVLKAPSSKDQAGDPEIQTDPSEHQAYQWVDAKEVPQWIHHPSNLEMFNTLLPQLDSW